MTDLRVGVANCPAVGKRWTEVVAGSRIRRRRNHMQFVVSGWTIDWYQTPEFHDISITSREQFEGLFVPTSDVFVRDVPPDRVQQATDAVHDICWLMRLASMSAVAPFETEYDGRTRRWSVMAGFHEFRPPIQMHDGRTVEQFVHSCWAGYRRLKRSRQLPVAIDYLVYAEGGNLPMEAKLLLAFTALEHLKATWARSQRIPLIAGYYRQRDAAGNANRRSSTLSFANLLRSMLAEVKMRAALRTVIRLRNRLIHSGITRSSTTRNFEVYAAMLVTIHRYLFRLLGYRAPMMDYRSMARRIP